MYCHCKELPFCYVSLEKKEDYICKYNVYKCNRLKSDGPKKKSCDFLKKDLVTKKKDNYIEPPMEPVSIIYERNYRQELFNYIRMCEQFGPNENYYGNIVNRMSILGYKYIPFERLSMLKKRLEKPPNKNKLFIKKLSNVLLTVPEELRVIKNNKKNKKIIKKKTFEEVEIIETESDEEDEIDNEDNVFDVDDLDSVDDENDNDFEGYLSD